MCVFTPLDVHLKNCFKDFRIIRKKITIDRHHFDKVSAHEQRVQSKTYEKRPLGEKKCYFWPFLPPWLHARTPKCCGNAFFAVLTSESGFPNDFKILFFYQANAFHIVTQKRNKMSVLTVDSWCSKAVRRLKIPHTIINKFLGTKLFFPNTRGI